MLTCRLGLNNRGTQPGDAAIGELPNNKSGHLDTAKLVDGQIAELTAQQLDKAAEAGHPRPHLWA